MRKMRKLSMLLITVMMVIMMAVPALANEKTDEPFFDDSVSGSFNSNVFVSGENVTSEAKVDGILFAAGNGVEAAGSSEYIMEAGNTISANGEIEKDAFMAGRILNINGKVGRDVYAAAQNINITGKVGGKVYAAAQKIVISGTVKGDLYLQAESIVITEDAKIKGILHCPDTADVSADQSIIDAADIYHVENSSDIANISNDVADKLTFAYKMNNIKSKIIGSLGLLLIALLIFWLTPFWNRVDVSYEGKSFGSYAAAFAAGFGILIAAPVLAVLLMISGIGFRLGILLILSYIASIVVSTVFAGFFIGKLIWRNLLHKDAKIWAELIIGILVFRIISMIPVVSFISLLIAIPFGIGVLFFLFIRSKEKYIESSELMVE